MHQIFKILLILSGVLLVHFSFIYFVGRNDRSNSRAMKLIIDTDAGSDDAVALMLALALPVDELDVLAITCTYGNTNESNVETNVLKVLTIARRSDIPVYGGAEKPLLQNYTSDDYFGIDGLGDFDFGREIVGSVDRTKHAAVAMIDLVKRHPGEVNILTLGPLTNVALATRLYEDFSKSVKRFYVMGATVNESNSENPEVEFNFGLDPEANLIFLNSITNRTSLVAPNDVVLKNGIAKEWRKGVLGKADSQRIEFLNKAEYALLDRVGVWYSADAIAVAAMIWPPLVTSSREARMTSATCAGPRNGAVEVDYGDVHKNVEVVRDFDVDGFKKKLLKYLACDERCDDLESDS